MFLTSGMKTTTLTAKAANKLGTTQRVIENIMLGISKKERRSKNTYGNRVCDKMHCYFEIDLRGIQGKIIQDGQNIYCNET